MAFLLGTATDENDLLGQFVSWLVTLGWVENMAPTINGDHGGKRAHLTKNGIFVNLQSGLGDTDVSPGYAITLKGFYLYLSTGYDGSQEFMSQPGGPMDTLPMRACVALPTAGFSGAFPQFFAFADAADNVVLVLERSTLNFSHLGWGPSLVKAGAWTGGPYFFSEYYRINASTSDAGTPLNADCPFTYSNNANGFIRADVDGFVGKWVACTSGVGNYSGNAGKNCYSEFGGVVPSDIPHWDYGQGLFRIQPSQINGQAALIPVDVYVPRDAGGSSLLGTLPNIFLCNAVGRGFGPATDYYIGADDYMLFPGSTPMYPGTPGFGYAIKKN